MAQKLMYIFVMVLVPVLISTQRTNDFGFHLCVPGSGRTSSGNLWYLQALNDNSVPSSQGGICHAMSLTDPKTPGPYQLNIDLLGAQGCTQYPQCSHPGFLFNALDEFNFEFVYFRTHSPKSGCYAHGYMKNGGFHYITGSVCSHVIPRFRTWFNVKVAITGAIAKMYLNNVLLVTLNPHFPARRWGGAVTLNHYKDVIMFKNYKLTTSSTKP